MRSNRTGPPTKQPSHALRRQARNRRITVRDIAAAKERGEKWPMLTAYDAMTASVFDEAGIPVLLVGDSTGNWSPRLRHHRPGHPRRDDPAVRRRRTRHQARPRRRRPALRLVPGRPRPGAAQRDPAGQGGRRGRGQAGGRRAVAAARSSCWSQAGIPVMAHLGLTPQSVNAFGGYRVQGRGEEGAHGCCATPRRCRTRARSRSCWSACRPSWPPRSPRSLHIPTIGIGAGPDCDAQVLVWTGHGRPDPRQGRSSSSSTPTCASLLGRGRQGLRRRRRRPAPTPAPEHSYR